MGEGHKFKEYIYWGITAFCVIASSIAFGYLLLRIEQVKAFFVMVLTILMPVIYGAVLAYLLAPVYNWCVRKSDLWLKPWISNQEKRLGAGKFAGTVVSLIMLVLVVAGLISMLLPLIDSIQSVIGALPGNINNFLVWAQKMLDDHSDIMEQVAVYTEQAMEWGKSWGKNVVAPNLDKIISSLSSGMFSIVVLIKNILIGLIVMVYLLNMKDGLVTIAKKCMYSLFPVVWANRIIDEVRFIHQVFGGFIIGKLLDSLIIGIICFFCMSLMKMPYVLLISVIIGITNIIPFFGPFIGAVPSAVLVLLVNPIQCVYFLIFILLLQQFDGNILGPKILGESTGVSSFWVLFSILLFGGLFGFLGMIIGVPTFAVIYRLVSDGVKAALRKRKLPTETAAYEGVSYIDAEKMEIRSKGSEQAKARDLRKKGPKIGKTNKKQDIK
ncbi:MAG: AI-2E family transporter [Lachnospiraceae bacterium]|jgi:predicted PurR-regulated permease PerM|nr:AI-2E family transporter [Lachnospiraceae bacterium]